MCCYVFIARARAQLAKGLNPSLTKREAKAEELGQTEHAKVLNKRKGQYWLDPANQKV